MSDVDSDSAETVRLLALAGAGDRAAFNELFDRYRGFMLHSAERRLSPRVRPRLDASDVVQEAHLDAFQRLGDFLRRRPMSFRLWLLKTVHERLLKIERRHLAAAKRSVDREVLLSDASSMDLARQFTSRGSSPSSPVQTEELAGRIRMILAGLSESEREIILLRNFDGLSNQEVAALLELNPETTKKRYSRALLRLESLMRNNGLTESRP